jgi:hypothetical protein
MKTPLTDASTVIVHASGKAFAVVPASVSQMLELRRTNLELSQDMAWAIIKLADWTNQSSAWQASARDWQQNLYVQRELSLNYIPGPRPQVTEDSPTTMPEALKLIAELRQQQHDLETRLQHAENALDELETIVTSLEHEANTRTIHQN